MLPGLVGCIQAGEALKVLLGLGEPLIGRILSVDAAGAIDHDGCGTATRDGNAGE